MKAFFGGCYAVLALYLMLASRSAIQHSDQLFYAAIAALSGGFAASLIAGGRKS